MIYQFVRDPAAGKKIPTECFQKFYIREGDHCCTDNYGLALDRAAEIFDRHGKKTEASHYRDLANSIRKAVHPLL